MFRLRSLKPLTQLIRKQHSKIMNPNLSSLINLYVSKGDEDYYGDIITKKEHMIQCSMLAQQNNESDELVIGCLLHDVGHLLSEDDMNGYGVKDHGIIGADYLKNNLHFKNNYILNLISQHINAKRYLVYKKGNDYFNKLSNASRITLGYQGGPMDINEALIFENNYSYMLNDILKVREYDDKGKDGNMEIVELDYFIPLLEKYFE